MSKKNRKNAVKRDPKSVLIKIGVIAFVAIFALVLLFSALRYTTGIFDRATTALSIGDKKISAMDLRIIRQDSRTSFLYNNSLLLQIYGYNLSTIDSQACLYDNTISWGTYFNNQAINQAVNIMILNKAAEDSGYKISDEVRNDVAEYIDSIKKAAKDGDMSVKKYLKTMYGKNVSLPDVESIALRSQYATDYYNHTRKNFRSAITEQEVKDYYNENKKTYDVAEYYSLVVPYTEYKFDASKADQEGMPTSEADATQKTENARIAAQALANEIKEKVTLENFDEIAKEYWTKIKDDNKIEDFTTRLTSGKMSDSTSVYGKWYNVENIAQGTKIVLDNTDKHEYIVALYVGRHVEEIETVNVRHILIAATTNISDDLSDEQKAELEAKKKAAKEEADKLLAEFLAGDKSVESFAALASEHSEDPGSVHEGGLYEDVAPGDMVKEFDAWIFDKDRKVGDTGVVETTNGYHVMLFCGNGDLKYISDIKDALTDKKYEEFYETISKDLKADSNKLGMFFAF